MNEKRREYERKLLIKKMAIAKMNAEREALRRFASKIDKIPEQVWMYT